MAYDGSQTAQSDSPPYRVAFKPPQVAILGPASGVHVQYGQMVALVGEATDPQKAPEGLVLAWRNGSTLLGGTATLSLDNLPVGVNHLSLTATNAAGLTATAPVDVIVDDDLNLLGPTLTAGPLQFAWTVAPGTTQLQTAALAIANGGGGSITWTAASGAAWLTVDSASGTAPGAGHPDGQSGGHAVRLNPHDEPGVDGNRGRGRTGPDDIHPRRLVRRCTTRRKTYAPIVGASRPRGMLRPK